MSKLKLVCPLWEDYLTMTESGLRETWKYWHPLRNLSSSRGECNTICAAIETVAKLRGFNVETWEER